MHIILQTQDQEGCRRQTVNGKARGQITIPAEADEDTAMAAARAVDKVQAQIDGKDIKKIIYVQGRILNIIAK